jgi:hypothetical protein
LLLKTVISCIIKSFSQKYGRMTIRADSANVMPHRLCAITFNIFDYVSTLAVSRFINSSSTIKGNVKIYCFNISKILPSRRFSQWRHKNWKWPMKWLDSLEVTNEIAEFLYLWRHSENRRLGRIFDIDDMIKSECCFMWYVVLSLESAEGGIDALQRDNLRHNYLYRLRGLLVSFY